MKTVYTSYTVKVKGDEVYHTYSQVLGKKVYKYNSYYNLKKSEYSLTCLQVTQVFFSRGLLILGCLKLLFSKLLKVFHRSVKTNFEQG